MQWEALLSELDEPTGTEDSQYGHGHLILYTYVFDINALSSKSPIFGLNLFITFC